MSSINAHTFTIEQKNVIFYVTRILTGVTLIPFIIIIIVYINNRKNFTTIMWFNLQLCISQLLGNSNNCFPMMYSEELEKSFKKIFNSLIVPHIESHDDFLKDYKTLLQESVQTVKKSVTYNLIGESGPAHKKSFKVEVVVDGLVFGVGEGSTKKSAEQEAAKNAYMKRAK